MKTSKNPNVLLRSAMDQISMVVKKEPIVLANSGDTKCAVYKIGVRNFCVRYSLNSSLNGFWEYNREGVGLEMTKTHKNLEELIISIKNNVGQLGKEIL